MSANEETLLRSVAWQNAEAIRAAKQRAEDELARAMETLERRSQDLARSLAMTRATLEATPDGILVTDANGQVTGLNSNFLQMWRLPPTFQDPEQYPRILAAISPQVSNPTQFQARMRASTDIPNSFDLFQLSDGRVFEGYSRAQTVSGEYVGHVWVFRDVTERRRAEESLHLRDRAIQALSLGLVITDPAQEDNPIIYVSPGFERMTGYSFAEVVGRNCRFLQGRDTDMSTVARVREAIRAGAVVTVELLNYRKDGSTFWNELTISPVHNNDGRIVNFIGIQIDVTQRRMLEDRLRHSQKMEAIGRLAGGVAHDFNNLLTVINGFSEMVLNALSEQDSRRAMLEEVRKAGVRAANLTQQLLAFSRKSMLAPRILDVNTLIRDLQRMLRPLLGEDIELETSLASNLGRVHVDGSQFEQALINLCVNARDAMPNGGKLTLETHNVELDVTYAETHNEVTPGAYVLIAVSDAGVGMSREVRARLFEPFFTTKGVGKGTGLGLSMVFGFIKQSGGHVAIYSESGSGTTVKLYLPRIEEQSTPVETRVDPLPRGTETILLVEDEAAVRLLGRHVLQQCGYTVLEASHGREALQLLQKHQGPLHLLFTDLVMPYGMTGSQVAEKVLALHPEAKVLFTSGYTDDAVVRHGLLQARNQFLQKPFSPSALAHKVRAILDRPATDSTNEPAR